jgi:hypothetical protein
MLLLNIRAAEEFSREAHSVSRSNEKVQSTIISRMPRRRRTAEQRDEFATFHDIELHLLPQPETPQYTATAGIKSVSTALRHSDRAYVSVGSKPSVLPRRLPCPLSPIADIGQTAALPGH